MNVRRIAIATTCAAAVVGGTATIILACGGNAKPNCFQTAWIAKFPPAVVVLPPGGGAIAVPIGILPFVSWNTNPLCAQPSAATIGLSNTPKKG